jgi:hypothetical protein
MFCLCSNLKKNDVWQKPAASVVSRYVALLIMCRGPLAKCTCCWNSSSSNGVKAHMGCCTQRDEPLVCSAPGCQGAGRLWTHLGHLCDSDCHRVGQGSASAAAVLQDVKWYPSPKNAASVNLRTCQWSVPQLSLWRTRSCAEAASAADPSEPESCLTSVTFKFF